MPFIGNPEAEQTASNRVWMRAQKDNLNIAMVEGQWITALELILEAIAKCERWADLAHELQGLFEKLVPCYAALGMVAEMNAARARLDELRRR